MLLFIWLNIHSCGHVGGNCVWSCVRGVGGSCVVWGSCVRGIVWGAMGQWVGLRGGAGCVGVWCCVRELCGDMHTSHQMVWPYTHNCPQYCQHKGDSPLPSHPSSPSHPAHSSSQVVHCRVCPPHPLHAPVLVLHLAVYPTSPTQGRVVSLTGCHTVHRHSAT